MGGTGLEPVTPSVSKRLRRSRPFARVRARRGNCVGVRLKPYPYLVSSPSGGMTIGFIG
jgi:hypothetical protein